MEIFIRLLPYVLSVVTSVLAAFCTYKVKKIADGREKEAKDEEARQKAIADGIQSLLRESIIANYNKYSERGYCPIYAKTSIKEAYEAYHKLGGNDVATALYKDLVEMPPEKEN